MENSSALSWAKELGFAGLVLFASFALLRSLILTVVQYEALEYWNVSLKPILLSDIELRIAVWEVVVLVVVLITLVFWVLSIPTRPRTQTMASRWNGSRTAPLPSAFRKTDYSQAEIIRATVWAREGKLSPDQLATIIDQAVRLKRIKPCLGAEILNEFGFDLVLRADESHQVVRRQVEQ